MPCSLSMQKDAKGTKVIFISRESYCPTNAHYTRLAIPHNRRCTLEQVKCHDYKHIQTRPLIFGCQDFWSAHYVKE